MKGLISYWQIDITKIRKTIDNMSKTLGMVKINPLLKQDLETSCDKMKALLNKGKT